MSAKIVRKDGWLLLLDDEYNTFVVRHIKKTVPAQDRRWDGRCWRVRETYLEEITTALSCSFVNYEIVDGDTIECSQAGGDIGNGEDGARAGDRAPSEPDPETW